MLMKIGRLGLDGGGADQGPTMPVKVDHRPSTINGWVDRNLIEHTRYIPLEHTVTPNPRLGGPGH